MILIIRKIIFKITKKISLRVRRPKGYVLISYITSPFLRKKNNFSLSHTNDFECFIIANTFLKKNYNVDIIDWNNYTFLPKRQYTFFLDIHNNIERLFPYLNKTKKIFHVTGAHWSFMNEAEHQRLKMLEERRCIKLPPRRSVVPTKNIELSDYACGLGNKFTYDTYSFAHKEIFPIPISTTKLFDFPAKRNIQKVKNNFIWFGGTGFVHKGLDLVLEAFKEMPDYNLSVIGPINKESDFETAFKNELYETNNITTYGWLPIDDPKFIQITENSIGLVYPSCSEGGGGSVITCMHSALIPILTYESSVDVDKFGIILKAATKEEIKRSVLEISHLSNSELLQRTKAAWNYAREKHTRETFNDAFNRFIDKIIKENEQ